MQLLWAGLTTLFGAFIALLGRKSLVAIATIAAFVAITAAFIASMQALLVALGSLFVIPSWVVYSLGIFVPSNTLPCVAAIFSARSVKFAYRLAMAKLQAINAAT